MKGARASAGFSTAELDEAPERAIGDTNQSRLCMAGKSVFLSVLSLERFDIHGYRET